LSFFSLAVCLALLNRIKRLVKENNDLWDAISKRDESEAKRAENLKKNFSASHAHFMSQAVATKSVKSLRESLSDLVIAQHKKLGQELLGDVSDKAESLVRDLDFALNERIWDAFQQLKEKLDDSPQVLPRNAKIAYTKGSRTVIVIEQEPQVRSVSFTGSLINREVADQASGRTENGYRYNLSFPYVMFMIVFDQGGYTYHEVYFRNKTLTSAREHVYLAPLPNVNRKNKETKPMCMGKDFRGEISEESTMTRKCELVVADFWTRTFNEHLGTGGFEKIDERINSLAKWQEETQKDPLFVLSVNWGSGKTMKGIVESALDERSRDSKLDWVDSKVKEILDAGVAKIAQLVKEELKKPRTLTLKEDLVTDTIKNSFESILTEHTKKVFEHCTKG
jgi:hypothetical protein